jgi:hypothetical protein
VGLCGCKISCLTLREEHRLRLFEDRVPRRIFESKRDEVTGGWRKLHNEELHNLYASPSIITIIKRRRIRWMEHVARMREKRNTYRILVGRPEGNIAPGRPRRRWVASAALLQGKNPRYTLDWSLSGPQSRYGRREEKNSWLYRDLKLDLSVVQPVASCYLLRDAGP